MRSTRRGFGRRALSFGLAIFCAITLMSVGFAAWVLSNNASLDSTGGIKTETITDKSVNIVITNADKNKVLYDSVDDNKQGIGDPQNLVFGHLPVDNPDANKGYIQTDGEIKDGVSKALNEDLFFTVKGTADNIDKIGELHFQVRVPDSLLTAAGLSRVGDTWSYDPAKAFIRLPSFARDSEGNQIPYITGALTAPDGEGKVKYEFPAKTDNWAGAMTQDVLWEDPSALLTAGTATIKDLDGNEYTITYVSGRTDKLEFELTIKFEWGARYLGMNPNYFYDVEERKLGEHDQLTSATDVPHKYTTADMNMVNYDLLLLQAVVNGLKLENYFTANTVSESEVYKDTGIVLETDQTLEAYINANPDGIKAKLALLQENIETAIAHLGVGSNPKAPVYAFWIYADVK